MLFNLIVTLFAMINGVQGDTPVARFANREAFPTEEACKNYFETENGKQAKIGIEVTVSRMPGQYVAAYSCVPVGKVNNEEAI